MEDDKREPQKVFLVNPPSENPWRTRQDYVEEQRRAKIQFWITIITVLVSLLGVVATTITAIESLRKVSASTTQDQLPKSKLFDSKLAARAENELKNHIEILKSGKNGRVIWGKVRDLNYELKPGDTDDTLLASLNYEEDFSTNSNTSFVKYARRELELTYIKNKWWLTGGRQRFFAPEGEENPIPDWTPITQENMGIALELNMDIQVN
jgi:hypothetical protein